MINYFKKRNYLKHKKRYGFLQEKNIEPISTIPYAKSPNEKYLFKAFKVNLLKEDNAIARNKTMWIDIKFALAIGMALALFVSYVLIFKSTVFWIWTLFFATSITSLCMAIAFTLNLALRKTTINLEAYVNKSALNLFGEEQITIVYDPKNNKIKNYNFEKWVGCDSKPWSDWKENDVTIYTFNDRFVLKNVDVDFYLALIKLGKIPANHCNAPIKVDTYELNEKLNGNKSHIKIWKTKADSILKVGIKEDKNFLNDINNVNATQEKLTNKKIVLTNINKDFTEKVKFINEDNKIIKNKINELKSNSIYTNGKPEIEEYENSDSPNEARERYKKEIKEYNQFEKEITSLTKEFDSNQLKIKFFEQDVENNKKEIIEIEKELDSIPDRIEYFKKQKTENRTNVKKEYNKAIKEANKWISISNEAIKVYNERYNKKVELFVMLEKGAKIWTND